jgi:hypothetical protein
MLLILKGFKTGGESGIRTHVRVSPKHAFQACAFSHSAISPTGQQVTKQAFEKRRTLTPWRACDSFRTVYQTSPVSLECFASHHPLVPPRVQMAALGKPDAGAVGCRRSANAGVWSKADRLERGGTSHQRVSSLVERPFGQMRGRLSPSSNKAHEGARVRARRIHGCVRSDRNRQEEVGEN